jgi:hypothetical protein
MKPKLLTVIAVVALSGSTAEAAQITT